MKDVRVNANQIDLQIQDHEHEGDAILFLHFSGANLMMWQKSVPYFKDHYRLVLVDLRGHGKSDRPETGYSMDEMARDVVGVMEHLRLERAHIVGSSLGAEVGLNLAANHPERVISLVCDGALASEYGAYGTWEGSKAEFKAHVASQLQDVRNRPQTAFPSVDALVKARRDVYEKLGWWNEDVEAMERYGAYEVAEGHVASGMGKQAMEDYMRGYFHTRLEDDYRRVKCPLLMVAEAGSDDEREKVAAKGLCELAEQGEIQEVDGWVHPYGWLLDPEAVSQAILQFLADTAQ